jgi:uncharacterized membrane protein (DUF2068 family)
MRIAVAFLFGVLAYTAWEIKRWLIAFICSMAVILFQPVQKLAFHKEQWQVIDLLVILLLVIWIVIDIIKRHPQKL